MSVATIQQNLAAILTLLHPAGPEISELRAAGVASARIIALYPPDFTAVTAGLHNALRTPEQLAKFLPQLTRGSAMQRLEVLEDRVPGLLYGVMTEEVRQTPYDGPAAQALWALVDENMQCQFWNLKPSELINGALLNTASILWLAARWRQVPGLEEPAAVAEIAALTGILRAALAA